MPQRWTSNFTRHGPAWRAHDGIVLASMVKGPDAGHASFRGTLFTAGSDSMLKVRRHIADPADFQIWDISSPESASERPQQGLQGPLPSSSPR